MDVVVISFEKEVLKQVSDLFSRALELDNIFVFDNPTKAEKHLNLHPADFVLLDADDDEAGWIIPYKRMKAFNPSLKVALMSSTREVAVKAYETGVWDYLLKPVKESQLERIISKCK